MRQRRCLCGLPLAGLLVVWLGCSPATEISQQAREQVLAELEQRVERTAASQMTERIDAILLRELNSRRLSTSTNAAWQILHGVVAYGQELQIMTEDRGVTGAIDYAFSEGVINGFELSLSRSPLPSTGRPGIVARLEPGSYVGQGHPDQWLAVFAMADLPAETPIAVGGQSLTILDLARQAQYDVPNNLLNEFSWTLIGLTHYLPEEPRWVADGGETISWELLVEAELTYDIDTSACGGTHRLAGIVRALHAKHRLGLPDSSVWTRAQQVVDACVEDARQYRSSNGALSSYYFMRPSQTVDLSAELSGSGHVFEFLALALPAEELQAPWVELAGNRLCDVLDATQGVELDCGALYHALNGLKIYRQRLLALGAEAQ